MSIFKEVKTDIDYLFPKSIRDYLPDDHEVWVLHDIFNNIDISNITNQYSSGGKTANSPLAMLETIFYSSLQGIVPEKSKKQQGSKYHIKNLMEMKISAFAESVNLKYDLWMK